MGLLYDERLACSLVAPAPYDSFEHCIVSVDFGRSKLNMVSVYRPPNLSIPKFIEDFELLLSHVTSSNLEFIIAGDFNIHVDDDSDKNSNNFKQLLSNFNLKQHTNFPTHNHGHTLDLLITADDCKFIDNVKPGSEISDHTTVIATLDFKPPPPTSHKITTYRPFNKIDRDQFSRDLLNSDLIKNPEKSALALYRQYHGTLSDLVNQHAPLKTRPCPARPPDPWMNDEILVAKRRKRQLERSWRRTRLKSDRVLLTKQCTFSNVCCHGQKAIFIVNW